MVVKNIPNAGLFQRAVDSHAPQCNYALKDGNVKEWVAALDIDC
jgi:hypothetical protein